jgi:hypothetical protein
MNDGVTQKESAAQLREDLYPWVLGVSGPVILFAYERLCVHSLEPSAITQLLSGALTIEGVIVGFVATILAILFALPGGAATEAIKATKHFARLVGFAQQTIYVSLVVTCSALTLLVVQSPQTPQWFHWALLAWVYLLAAALLTFQRLVAIIVVMLKAPPK